MKTSVFMPTFTSILKKYDLLSTNVIIVSDVMRWCHEHGLFENNPFRLALAAKRSNSEISDIVIKDVIVNSDIAGVTSAMDYRGFKHVKEISDLKTFILHTFLHEIAHAKGIPVELNADVWAYNELASFEGQLAQIEEE